MNKSVTTFPHWDSVRRFILSQELIAPQDHILIAYSAGPDSRFLFECLRYLYPATALQLIYFNHGLRSREEIQGDISHVMTLAEQTGVSATIKTLPVRQYAQRFNTSVETAGHYLRRSFLRHIASLRRIPVIATAHHQDDDLETMLFQLCRGTRQGFKGISPKEKISASSVLVRPLLPLSKADILSVLQECRLDYKEDSTNQMSVYSRNIIRHRIIPELEIVTPGFRANWLELKTHWEEENRFIEETLKTYGFHEAIYANTLLDKALFLHLPDFLMKQALYRFLRYHALSLSRRTLIDRPQIHPEARHIHLIAEAIRTGKNTVIQLPGSFEIQLENSRIRLAEKSGGKRTGSPGTKQPFSYVFKTLPDRVYIKEASCWLVFKHRDMADMDISGFNPSRAYLDFNKISSGPFEIRNTRPGDRFTPLGSSGHKKVGDFFTDRKVPREKRACVPLFFAENKLVWIANYEIADDAKITKETKRVLQIEMEPVY